MAYIYVLTNTINNKKYVGQTIDIKRRFSSHKRGDNNQLISKAIKKYGWNNFKKFYFWCPEFLLDFFEKFLIRLLNTLISNGYNLDTGGNKNKHYSDELRKTLSEVHKGKNTGKDHPGSKKVICLETGIIYESGKEASKLLNINYSSLMGCCQEIQRSATNLHFKFFTDEISKLDRKGLDKLIEQEEKLKIDNIYKGNKNKKGKPSWNKNKKCDYAKGKKNANAKSVLCITTGEIFDTITEAGEAKNISFKGISRCCTGSIKTSGGYEWKYLDESKSFLSSEAKKKMSFSHIGKLPPNVKKVLCIEINKIYNSIKEASILLNINNKDICYCCKGKRKTAGGYHWEYYIEENKENQKEAV